MDNIIKVTTDDGKTLEVEVLEIFSVTGYEDKEYILYTQNKEVDSDNIKAYISILEQNEDNFNLLGITDENEWNEVQKAIEEMEEMNHE